MIRPCFSFLAAFSVLGIVSALTAPPLSASGAIPDAFSLVPRRDAAPGSEQVSEPVTVYGLDTLATANLDFGSLSINGGPFSTALGEVRNGDVLRVKLAAPSNYSAAATATLSIGGVASTFVVSTIALRTTPDLFRFVPVLGAEPGLEYVSATIVASGINAPVPVSIVGGRYSVNGGEWTVSPGQIVNGDSIRLSVAAISQPAGFASASLTVGTVSAQFSVVNSGVDTVPDLFRFPGPVAGLSALAQTSKTILVSGISGPTTISSAEGTRFRVNEGPYSSLPGVVYPGDKVSLYVIAGPMRNDLRSGSVTIGGVSASFQVQTNAPSDDVSEPFAFYPATVLPGTEVFSSPVLVENINVPTPISVSGAPFSINGGAYSSQDALVKAGDIVTMKLLAPATSGQTKSATLTIGSGFLGSRRATWKVTAKTPSKPNAFTLVNANLYAGGTVPPGSVVTTAPVILGNATKPVAVKVSGGFYSINGGRYVSTDGVAANGDSIAVQMNASSAYETASSVTLSLGSKSAKLSITTCKDPVPLTASAYDGTTAFIYRNLSPVPLRVFVAYPKGWKAQDRRAARVQFFGGGYNHGDAGGAVSAAKYWAKRSGYVGFAPDYRVNERFGTSPTTVADDNRAIVRWIMENASTLGVDPSRVVVAGGSSAGGSALFAGLPSPPATTDPFSSPLFPVAAMSIRSGAIDVGNGDGTYASSKTDYFFPVSNQISPARHLEARTPPVIMTHGDADEQVPQSDAIEACNQLVALGTRCEFHNVPGGRHSLPTSASDQEKLDDEAFMTSIGVLPSLR